MKKARAFIFVNGEMENGERLAALITPHDYLVAADGGLRHLQHLGLKPHLLIGDLDSVDPEQADELLSTGIQVQKFPVAKNETDLELALQACMERGFSTIFIVAGLGGRIDQTLGNILLLTAPGIEDYDLRIIDGVNEIMLVRGKLTIEGGPGDVVSLIPLEGVVHGVRTSGLSFPLKNETLFRWQTRGISNVFTGNKAEIKIDEGGLLLCIHTRSR